MIRKRFRLISSSDRDSRSSISLSISEAFHRSANQVTSSLVWFCSLSIYGRRFLAEREVLK